MDYLLYAITKSGLKRSSKQINAKIHSSEVFNSLFISLLDAYIGQNETEIMAKSIIIHYTKTLDTKEEVLQCSWMLWDSLQYYALKATPCALFLQTLLNDNHTREDIIFARKVISAIIKHEYGYQDETAHSLCNLYINSSSASAIINKLAECDTVIAKANITSLLSEIIGKISETDDKIEAASFAFEIFQSYCHIKSGLSKELTHIKTILQEANLSKQIESPSSYESKIGIYSENIFDSNIKSILEKQITENKKLQKLVKEYSDKNKLLEGTLMSKQSEIDRLTQQVHLLKSNMPQITTPKSTHEPPKPPKSNDTPTIIPQSTISQLISSASINIKKTILKPKESKGNQLTEQSDSLTNKSKDFPLEPQLDSNNHKEHSPVASEEIKDGAHDSAKSNEGDEVKISTSPPPIVTEFIKEAPKESNAPDDHTDSNDIPPPLPPRESNEELNT